MRWAMLCLVVAGCGRVGFDDATAPCALHSFIDEPYGNSFDGADGVTTPLLVCSDAQLARLGQRPEDWNKSFVLGANIDLAGVALTPIGDEATPFTGTFDGDGHTLSNLRLDLPTRTVGLFGVTGDGAHLTNLSLRQVDVRGQLYVGALVGLADQNVVIDHVHVDGLVRGDAAGGVIGYAGCYTIDGVVCDRIVLDDITADVDVEGSDAVGGIIGGLYNETTFALLTNLHVSGRVKGRNAVGGIIGDMEPALLDRSSNSASVECDSDCGGAVGVTVYALRTIIRHTFSTGAVTCNTVCGGLAGEVEGGIERSYSTGNVTCTGSTCGGLAGLVLHHVHESYATGDVTSPGPSVAGLVADMEGEDLRDSYATGTVTSTGDQVGGLVGIGINVIVTRSYSTANVTGRDRVAGIIAEMASAVASTAVTDTFATGTISGNTATNRVAHVISYSTGPVVVTGNAYASTASCSNTAGTCSQIGTPVASDSAFYSSATPPLSTWDFAGVWQQNANGFPTLRNVPP